MTTLKISSFDDLTKIEIWQEFVWNGETYCAMAKPRVSTSHDIEIVYVQAKRRNFAIPSGWEEADVLESRSTPSETQKTMAMEILQEALNALDASALLQIATHLEHHRDMATKCAMASSFATQRDVLTSGHMDLVKMLASYCRASINAQTGKTDVKG